MLPPFLYSDVVGYLHQFICQREWIKGIVPPYIQPISPLWAHALDEIWGVANKIKRTWRQIEGFQWQTVLATAMGLAL